MMVEADPETVVLAFPLDLSGEMDHLTVSSNVFQQRHFGAQYTYHAQSANGRANSLHSYTFFFKTQKKNRSHKYQAVPQIARRWLLALFFVYQTAALCENATGVVSSLL